MTLGQSKTASKHSIIIPSIVFEFYAAGGQHKSAFLGGFITFLSQP
jgi:hypothetical protein